MKSDVASRRRDLKTVRATRAGVALPVRSRPPPTDNSAADLENSLRRGEPVAKTFNVAVRNND